MRRTWAYRKRFSIARIEQNGRVIRRKSAYVLFFERIRKEIENKSAKVPYSGKHPQFSDTQFQPEKTRRNFGVAPHSGHRVSAGSGWLGDHVGQRTPNIQRDRRRGSLTHSSDCHCRPKTQPPPRRSHLYNIVDPIPQPIRTPTHFKKVRDSNQHFSF